MFIRDIMKKTEGQYEQYQYLHQCNLKLLADIPNLIFGRTNHLCSDKKIILRVNDDLYVNVHIGCYDVLWDDDVDSESHSILTTYYKLFTYIYGKLGIKIGLEDEYVPEIDYSVYKISEIDSFVENNKLPKVLICNGAVYSSQFDDVDFTKMIRQLSEDYPYIQFITTDKIIELSDKQNVHYTGHIIKAEGGDLNEISYLSQFCNIIFGRPSGPYAFCHVKKNLKDMEKVFISPSRKLRWISFGNKSACKFVWISNPIYEYIYNIIKDELKWLSPLTLDNFIVRAENNKIYITPKIDIFPEDDLNVYFYLDGMKRWEHKNYVCGLGSEYWFSPFAGYDSDIHRVVVEFRTSKNLLFSIST